MVNKCCILACVTSQTAAVGRLANKKRAPDGLAGAKTHQTGAIAPFPAQGFAQRPCLRFRARQANPNSNLGTQTPKKRECPMIRARPAKLDSNLGAQRAQGRQIVLTRKCITFCAGLANPQRNAGAPNPRKVRQTALQRGCPQKATLRGNAFGLRKHVAILAETSTIKLLFETFPSVSHSKY